MAGLILGILAWGPFTLVVASAWSLSLPRSALAPARSPRARTFLRVGPWLSAVVMACLPCLGGPRERHGWIGESFWGWLVLDLGCAVAVLAGNPSARRSWPAG